MRYKQEETLGWGTKKRKSQDEVQRRGKLRMNQCHNHKMDNIGGINLQKNRSENVAILQNPGKK